MACCGCSEESLRIWRVRYLGLCYFILFAAFLTTQTLVTPLFKDVGLIALCLLYLFFAIGALFAPFIAPKLGFRLTFFICSAMYPTWIGISITKIQWLFLVMSAVLGFAGGPFWTAQGMYVNAMSQGKDAGRFNSAFNLLYFFATPIGNLVIGLILLTQSSSSPSPAAPSFPSAPIASPASSNSTASPFDAVPVAAAAATMSMQDILLYVLLAIGILGSLMFLLISVPDDVKMPPTGSLLRRLKVVARFFTFRRIQCYAPYMLYSGFVLGYNWGLLPTLVTFDLVPWIFVSYGLAQFLIAPGVGRAFDTLGWKAMLLINVCCITGAYIIIPVAKAANSVWPLYIAAAYLGVVENLTNTYIQSSMLQHFEEDVGPAVAIYRLLWALGIAAGFLLQLGLNYLWMTVVEAIICAVTVIIVLVFEFWAVKNPTKDEYTINS